MIPLLGLFGLLGLAVGSFLNVCIDRLPRNMSIVSGSSHCEACLRPLRPLDLVPVFSYLWLRGRCRYCGVSIPPRIPMVELATGLLFAVMYWRYGLGWELTIGIVYASLLLVIFVIDLELQLVLDVVVFSAMPVALAASFFWADINPLWSLVGGATGAAVLLLPYMAYRQGMGLGDVKLAGLIGLMAGFPLVLVALMLAILAGGLMASFLLALRLKGRKDAIPFAPFLTTGALVSLLWGQTILDWYPAW